MGQSKSKGRNDRRVAIFDKDDGIQTLNGRYQKETSPGIYMRAYNENQQKGNFYSKSGKALSGTLIGLGILSILVQSVILCVIHE